MSQEAAPVVLALPGPQYWFDFAGGEYRICGIPIIVHQEGGQGRGTGWTIWDGAVAASKHLELATAQGTRPPFNPPTCIELGSGTGLAGLSAVATTGLPTTLTDLQEVLPALQRNVDANPQVAQQVSVAACDWTTPQLPADLSPPYGLVLAADCVWLEHLVQPFVATLGQVAGPTSQVLLSYQSRSARVDDLLFSLLRQTFEVRPAELLPGEQDRGKIDLYWLTRRAAAA